MTAEPAPGQLTELGCYALPGHTRTPRDVVGEVAAAEGLGIGSVFLSERFNVKEIEVLCGAVAATTTTTGIATAATNHNTRHPMLTASLASTMHTMTGGRFALGLGRGFDALFQAIGLRPVTSAQLEDAVCLLRRMWRGERILGHDGPAGSYPYLGQESDFDFDIPVLLAAIGPRSLELAGRCMDGVVLHTFFSDTAMARAVESIARGARAAGRDPASIRVWSVLATIGDHMPEDLRLRRTVGRLATYLQGYGDVLVRMNDWDPAVLARFRADAVVQGIPGAIDSVATQNQLEHVASLLPDEWLSAVATGTPRQCATEVLRQFDLGASGVIMHGATALELAPVVTAYRTIRPATMPAFPRQPREDVMGAAHELVGVDDPAQVVDDIADVTPEWLTNLFRTHCGIDASVRDLSVTQISTGQMGISYRVVPEYAQRPAEAPSRFVVKLATGDTGHRALVAPGFAWEIGFYQHLAGRVEVRTAHCWHAAISTDQCSFTLILEDLAPAVAGRQTNGCTLAQARAAVRNLAGLHAPLWNDPLLHGGLAWLQPLDTEGIALIVGLHHQATETFVERYADVLAPDDVETLREAARLTERWAIANQHPFAVIHGDYRLDNLMFTPDGDDVAVLDWQTTMVGHPLRDVAYFLSLSLLPDLRRTHEKELVAEYHQELVRHGVEDFSIEDCYDGYRTGMMQGPLITTLGCVYSTSERTPDSDAMFLSMISRSCAAIRGLGTLDALAR